MIVNRIMKNEEYISHLEESLERMIKIVASIDTKLKDGVSVF
jgi:hypothetical protein